jgi:biotin carboxyl carrier protein
VRKFIINVNGNSYEVDVEEVSAGSAPVSRPAPSATKAVQAAPAPKAAASSAPASSVSAGQEVVESPMPGNIWKIIVKEGQEVKSGDVLLILEAMKMENEIIAPRDGKVASITTKEGSAVNTGDKLVIMD